MKTATGHARLAVLWLLELYFIYLFVRMGWAKFDEQGWWTRAFTGWGYSPGFRMLVGAVEVAAGIALIVPALAFYAAVALGTVMLGAWWTLALEHRWEDVAWVSAYAIGLAWVAWETRDSRLRRSAERHDGFIKMSPRPLDRQ